ncbi:MAG: hypothetical protein ACT4TC_23540 [Myxococcaceae bacterium]
MSPTPAERVAAPALSRFSPPVVIDAVRAGDRRVFVVRDDLLEGGTKQRAAIPFLREAVAAGYREFVYASPFAGFAQVALAASCRALAVPCTLFAEGDPGRTGPIAAHGLTQLAASFGARIQLSRTLSEAEAAAATHVTGQQTRMKVPLGFDTPGFTRHLRLALALQWEWLAAQVPIHPRRLWLPVGSGTLASVFREVVPREVLLQCVDVHVLPSADPRLQRIRQLDRTRHYSAPESFGEAVRSQPPVPSNHFYDGKLWQFLVRMAEDGDIWWNVGR